MSPIDRYRRPADLPPRIPVFPLRGAILLPRATLALNVFEPRYLAMLDDVMSGGRLIGIAQPKGGESAVESPTGRNVELHKVGCVGRVTTYQEMDDGRLVITLTGITRFETIDEAMTALPYRTMSVSYDRFVQDFSKGLGEEQVDREHLLKVLRAYLDANRMSADWGQILKASSEFLVNALSVMSPYGPAEKQALLEAVDLRTRTEVLVALAEMDMAAQGSGGGTLQ